MPRPYPREFRIDGPLDWRAFLNVHVWFTDANGVRWRRTEYIAPEEIVAPPSSISSWIGRRFSSDSKLFAGTIDDFYDEAIGAREVKGLNQRAFSQGYEVAFWNNHYYMRRAFPRGQHKWKNYRSARLRRRLDSTTCSHAHAFKMPEGDQCGRSKHRGSRPDYEASWPSAGS